MEDRNLLEKRGVKEKKQNFSLKKGMCERQVFCDASCFINTLTLCAQLEDIHGLVLNANRLDFVDISAVYLVLHERLVHLKQVYVSYYQETSFRFLFNEREPFFTVENAIANLLTLNVTQRKKHQILILILHLLVDELLNVLCIDMILDPC